MARSNFRCFVHDIAGKEEENGLARGAIYNGTMTYSYDTIDDCGAALCVACGEYAACPESKRPVCDGTKTIECEGQWPRSKSLIWPTPAGQ